MILAAPFVFGPVTFASGAVLVAASAAAAPVLIHLALRQKYRRTPFPAIRFVLATHKAGRRANRLKYLLLLLLRMLIVLLLVGILAGPAVTTTQRFTPAAAPADVVFCVDDSASMGYQAQGRSQLQRARELAGRLLEDDARFPTGSRFTLVTATEHGRPDPFTPLRSSVRAALDRLEHKPTDTPLGGVIAAAQRILTDDADRPRKEIILFTDLSAHAWRDVRRQAGNESEIDVYCVTVGPDKFENMALEVPAGKSRVLPTGKVLAFDVALRSYELESSRQVELLVDGRRVARSASVSLPAQTRRTLTLEAGPLEPGIHNLQWRMTRTDGLAIDDRRYLTIEVGDPVSVLVVGNGVPDTAASEARMIASLIAPDALAPSRAYYDVTQCSVESLPAYEPDGPRLVVFADVAKPTPNTWNWVTRFLQAGGTLLIVPGDSFVPTRYTAGEDVLPALPVEAIRLDPPGRMRILVPDHPYLKPFTDSRISSLAQREAEKCLRVSESDAAATVLAEFPDTGPAILVRDSAAGTVILLTFSPAPRWGNFGTQAGPFLVFLHTVLQTHSPRSTRVEHVATGVDAAIRPPDLPEKTSVWLRALRDGAETEPPRALEPSPDGRFTLDTAGPGQYGMEFRSDAGVIQTGYSVNLPDMETDDRRADVDRLRLLFEKERFRLVRDVADLGLEVKNRQIGRSIVGELALCLLAALVIESLYANRFYRNDAAP